jgi:hypothetical protein
MAHDPLIERTDGAAAQESGSRAAQAANLFDLRRIIGGVFAVWAVLLILLGLTESDAEIAKAAGVNINLWAGLGMAGISAVFLIWAFARPLGEELAEAEADAAPARVGPGSEQGGGRTGDDPPGGVGDPRPRRE